MNPIDIIILVVIFLSLCTIIYFRFIRHRGNKCYGCSEARKCNAMKTALKECHQEINKNANKDK